VFAQTRPADAVVVNIDHHKQGAWWNRNQTIMMANTKWIAFLDDDDELLPCHIEFLTDLANHHHADVAWGWFEVRGGTDPFPQHRGRQWDINDPHIFPITALVNRELIMDANASFHGDPDGTGNWEVQDLPFWKALHNAGGTFVGAPDTTWLWHHHTRNTSGLPGRW
jgi:glycosyltransferase involved in cell wall biosynthesis